MNDTIFNKINQVLNKLSDYTGMNNSERTLFLNTVYSAIIKKIFVNCRNYISQEVLQQLEKLSQEVTFDSTKFTVLLQKVIDDTSQSVNGKTTVEESIALVLETIILPSAPKLTTDQRNELLDIISK